MVTSPLRPSPVGAPLFDSVDIEPACCAPNGSYYLLVLKIPSGPGWGVDVNEDVVREHPWS